MEEEEILEEVEVSNQFWKDPEGDDPLAALIVVAGGKPIQGYECNMHKDKHGVTMNYKTGSIFVSWDIVMFIHTQKESTILYTEAPPAADNDGEVPVAAEPVAEAVPNGQEG
jgi:hypothetical protein